MPATYEPIATTTLGSAASSITFSSIPATYTDLRLVIVGTPAAGASLDVNFNSDTGANYSRTTLYGDGSTANSTRNTGLTFWRATLALATTAPSLVTLDIFSYAGSTYKTGLSVFSGDANGSGYQYQNVNLWRSTSAINRIDLGLGGTNFNTGTTATLYGIKAA